MKKIIAFLLSFLVFSSFVFSTDVNLLFSKDIKITISSEKKLRELIKEKFPTIRELKEVSLSGTNKYIFWLERNKNDFEINLSGFEDKNSLTYTIHTDKYLKVKFEEYKKPILQVKIEENYKDIFLGFLFLVLLPLISGYSILKYIKNLTNDIPKNVDEKVRLVRKITWLIYLQMFFALLCYCVSLLKYDFPGYFVYKFDLGKNLALCVIIGTFLVFLILAFFVSLFGYKYIIKIYGEKQAEPFLKRVLGLAGLPVIYFLVIYFVAFNLPKNILKTISNMPLIVQNGFWLLFGIVTMLLISSFISRFYFGKNDLTKKYKDRLLKIFEDLKNKGVITEIPPFQVIKGYVANAMVTGLFKEKIIFTEKLLKTFSDEEIKGVLFHELGHKKGKHIKIGIFVWFMVSLVIYSIFDYLKINFKINFGDNFIQFLISFALPYFLVFSVMMYFSRKRETEADFFAAKMIGPKNYIKTLFKLYYTNYVYKKGFLNFLQSHPPLIKRIENIAKSFNLSEEEVKEIEKKVKLKC